MTIEEKEKRSQYIRSIKYKLYKIHCTQDNQYRDENRELIDYVVDNVLSPQLKQQNPAELEALEILKERGIKNVKYQEFIPILSSGGKIEHLYVADIMVNDNTIIEIDGSYHQNTYKLTRDFNRDQITSQAGYKTKRYLPAEVKKLKEESFV